MSRNDILLTAYENDLYYATEFKRNGKDVMVFSVFSKDGEQKFREQMKGYIIEPVMDSHNENRLIGVVV